MSSREKPMVAALLTSLALAAATADAKDFADYSGAELYTRFCAACHGSQGHGDGPVASSFKIIVPDLTRIAKRQGGTFPAERIARIIDGQTVLGPHGSRDMPVWGFEFLAQNEGKPEPAARTATMIARLTEYLRSIQKD